VYLYPKGGDETALFVAATPRDPPGALLAIRHPLPGTKVEILGDKDKDTKQVRVLEGEYKGIEGWTYNECLRDKLSAPVIAHQEPGTASIKWSFKTGGSVESTPFFHNGSIYFGSGDRNLYALDAKTGAERWHCETDAIIQASCAAAQNKIFVGSKRGTLYAIDDSNGRVVWKFQSTVNLDSIFTTPLIHGNSLIFGSMAGAVHALSIPNGNQAWEFKTEAEANSSPQAIGETVYFGSRDGYMYAVKASAGSLIWKFNAKGTINDTAAIAPGSIIFTVNDDDPNGTSTYALDAITGSMQWQFTAPKESGGDFCPFVVGNKVFVTTSGTNGFNGEHYLYAVDKNTGSLYWKRHIPEPRSGFALYKNGLVFGSSDGLYIVSATDGAIQFVQKLEEPSQPFVYSAMAYFGSADSLCALNLPEILHTLPIASSFLLVPAGSYSVGSTNHAQNMMQPNSPNNSTNQNGSITSGTPGANKGQSQFITQIQTRDQEIRRLADDLSSQQSANDELKQKISSLEESEKTLVETMSQLRKDLSEKRIVEEQPSRAINKSIETKLEEPETTWNDVRDFFPVEYKNDLQRRFDQQTTRSQTNNSIGFTRAKVRFTIDKEGNPLQISVLSIDNDDPAALNECARFIEASGPFRPLLSRDLNKLIVNSQISYLANSPHIVSIELQANNHRY